MISKLDKVLEDLENKEKKIQEGLKGDGASDGESKAPELVRIDEVVNAIRKVRCKVQFLSGTRTNFRLSHISDAKTARRTETATDPQNAG